MVSFWQDNSCLHKVPDTNSTVILITSNLYPNKLLYILSLLYISLASQTHFICTIPVLNLSQALYVLLVG